MEDKWEKIKKDGHLPIWDWKNKFQWKYRLQRVRSLEKRVKLAAFWTCIDAGIIILFRGNDEGVSIVALCLILALWVSALRPRASMSSEAVAAKNKKPSHSKTVVPIFLDNLKITLGLTLIMLINFHQTYWGNHLKLVGYDFVQHSLNRSVKEAFPVYVIDISEVPYVSDGYGVRAVLPLRVIDRATLQHFIAILTQNPKQSPASIGIDVNFSPISAAQSHAPPLPLAVTVPEGLSGGRPFLAANDSTFFDYCLRQQQGTCVD